MLTRNTIALNHCFVLFPAASDGSICPARKVAEIIALLICHRYRLDKNAFKALRKTSAKNAERFIQEVRSDLGNNFHYEYFAETVKQIIENGEAEEFVDAIDNYYETYSRSEKYHRCFRWQGCNEIELGDETSFLEIFRNLVSSCSFTASRYSAKAVLNEINWFIQNYPAETLETHLPEQIASGETAAILALHGIGVQKITAEDVLRIIIYKAGGSPHTDKEFPCLHSIPRRERVRILEVLEEIELNPAEMYKKYRWWQKAGEILHPGEYARRFPKTLAAFSALRKKPIRSPFSRFEQAKTLEEKLDFLQEHPIEFARRLDGLLRRAVSPEGGPEIEEMRKSRRAKRAARSNYVITVKRSHIFDSITEKLVEGIEWGGYAEMFRLGEDQKVNAFLKEKIEDTIKVHKKAFLRRFSEISGYTPKKRPGFRDGWFELEENANSAAPPKEDLEPIPMTESAWKKANLILERFEKIVPDLSAKDLCKLLVHFERRRKNQRNRRIRRPDSRKVTKLPLLRGIDSKLADTVQNIIITALKEKFAALPPLGKCVIDSRLGFLPLKTKYKVDKIQKRCCGRKEFKTGDAEKLRFGISYHKFTRGDLDFCAILVNKENIAVIDSCRDTPDHRGESQKGETESPIDDCTKYVDIQLSEAAKEFNYIIFTVKPIDEGRCICPTFTMAELNNPKDEIFDSFLYKTWDATLCIAAYFDLRKKELISLDWGCKRQQNTKRFFSIIKDYLDPPISLKDLLRWHIEARGGEILPEERKEEAETIFGIEDFIQNSDEIEKWIAI